MPRETRSAEDQMSHQKWDDPKRLSIGIDCPPGNPRPPELFATVIKGVGLSTADFEDMGVTLFGAREYLVRPATEPIKRYLLCRRTIAQRLKRMYRQGLLRGARW